MMYDDYFYLTAIASLFISYGLNTTKFLFGFFLRFYCNDKYRNSLVLPCRLLQRKQSIPSAVSIAVQIFLHHKIIVYIDVFEATSCHWPPTDIAYVLIVSVVWIAVVTFNDQDQLEIQFNQIKWHSCYPFSAKLAQSLVIRSTRMFSGSFCLTGGAKHGETNKLFISSLWTAPYDFLSG